MPTRMWSNRNSFIAVGYAQWHRHLGINLGSSAKSKHVFVQQSHSLLFAQGRRKCLLTQNMYTDVCSNFVHNCENIGATKTSLTR